MARQGIYVDGKKIIARYIGDKKVWERELEKLFITWTLDKEWSRSFVDYTKYIAETVDYLETSQTDDIEFQITRVSIGERSWRAKTFGTYISKSVIRGKKRVITRISFHTSIEMNSFISATILESPGEIKIYKEND